MYSPIVAILVAAENATELPRLGKPRMKLSVHASHTARRPKSSAVAHTHTARTEGAPVRTGDWCFLSTLWKNLAPGIALSRANAYIMRELLVIEKVPQRYMHTMTIRKRSAYSAM